MKTLYEYATEVMSKSIEHYLKIASATSGFQNFTVDILKDSDTRELVLSGKSLEVRELSSEECLQDLQRVTSIAFDVEKGISLYVYKHTREYIQILIQIANDLSNNFSTLQASDVKEHSYLLPIWQAALSIGSKANLKTIFGTATDRLISKPSAKKIADHANSYFLTNKVSAVQITERVERTLEGIIRDLVGRLLLESVVRNALDNASVPYLTEAEYSGIDGVVYKFRADFVIPNEKEPMAFIEVRKSSSRHASLYAKDKMFSAINWKGKHPNLLGIIVTEGDWTNESLVTMAKVFDYVVPLANSEMLAKNIKLYLEGDKSILKWIINFSIQKNPQK